ncbi:hypothetical protein [Paraburkholderia antibiotica]|uniref:DUF3325 domain-containing protein n=1 Tax=Paraburkholderia antibiotica TaxID=2728839 RepID=A0A7X9X6A0_9BURK|nr:hypothetical protein [Paraburkholderia antibiotica]NML32216.1 hypothetical protein [Paraburkholderia antibiotica]
MKLTDWIVTLAILLMAIAFLCARRRSAWSRNDRVRHMAGTRLLMQAACALWAALLIVAHGLFMIDDLGRLRPTSIAALAGVAGLVLCSCYWSVRGHRLLKSRRIFGG